MSGEGLRHDKVLSQKAKDCVESNTEVLSQKIAVDASSLSKSARKLGRVLGVTLK